MDKTRAAKKVERQAHRREKAAELLKAADLRILDRPSKSLFEAAAKKFYKMGEAGDKTGYENAAKMYRKMGVREEVGFAKTLIEEAGENIAKGEYERAIDKVSVAIDIYGEKYNDRIAVGVSAGKPAMVGSADMATFSEYLSYAYSRKADAEFKAGDLNTALSHYKQALEVDSTLNKSYRFNSRLKSHSPWMPAMNRAYSVDAHIHGSIATIYNTKSDSAKDHTTKIKYLEMAMTELFGTDSVSNLAWRGYVRKLEDLTSVPYADEFLKRLTRDRYH